MMEFVKLVIKIEDFILKTKQNNNLDHNTALELERLDKAARELKEHFSKKPRFNNMNDKILRLKLKGDSINFTNMTYDNTPRSENYTLFCDDTDYTLFCDDTISFFERFVDINFAGFFVTIKLSTQQDCGEKYYLGIYINYKLEGSRLNEEYLLKDKLITAAISITDQTLYDELRELLEAFFKEECQRFFMTLKPRLLDQLRNFEDCENLLYTFDTSNGLYQAWRKFNMNERLLYLSQNASILHFTALHSIAIYITNNSKKLIHNKNNQLLLTIEQNRILNSTVSRNESFFKKIEEENGMYKHDPFTYLKLINDCLQSLKFNGLPEEAKELEKLIMQIMPSHGYLDILKLFIHSLHVKICNIFPSIQNPSELKNVIEAFEALEKIFTLEAYNKLENCKKSQEYKDIFKQKESKPKNISTNKPTTSLTLKRTADPSSESVTCKKRSLEKCPTDSQSQVVEDAHALNLQDSVPTTSVVERDEEEIPSRFNETPSIGQLPENEVVEHAQASSFQGANLQNTQR